MFGYEKNIFKIKRFLSMVGVAGLDFSNPATLRKKILNLTLKLF